MAQSSRSAPRPRTAAGWCLRPWRGSARPAGQHRAEQRSAGGGRIERLPCRTHVARRHNPSMQAGPPGVLAAPVLQQVSSYKDAPWSGHGQRLVGAVVWGCLSVLQHRHCNNATGSAGRKGPLGRFWGEAGWHAFSGYGRRSFVPALCPAMLMLMCCGPSWIVFMAGVLWCVFGLAAPK
eukprot:362110-Chlamydomonas_euryale.AAC.1